MAGEPILLHVCCGPCAIYPVRALRAEGFEPTGYFANPNIQPSREYRRRLEALRQYAETEKLPLIVREDYRPEEHLRATIEAPADRNKRCRACYDLRLGEAARKARELGFERFTTTLLVSPYQLHRAVREAGEEAAALAGAGGAPGGAPWGTPGSTPGSAPGSDTGASRGAGAVDATAAGAAGPDTGGGPASAAPPLEFVYRDFRPGWKEGVKASLDLGLYRQPYCGCLWSEVERYEHPRA